jgi:hypothetical protein
MNCRRHGSKPTLALWMLVAVADAAILTAATGVPVMLLVLLGVAVAGGVFVARALTHRDATTTEVAARRRA